MESVEERREICALYGARIVIADEGIPWLKRVVVRWVLMISTSCAFDFESEEDCSRGEEVSSGEGASSYTAWGEVKEVRGSESDIMGT